LLPHIIVLGKNSWRGVAGGWVCSPDLLGQVLASPVRPHVTAVYCITKYGAHNTRSHDISSLFVVRSALFVPDVAGTTSLRAIARCSTFDCDEINECLTGGPRDHGTIMSFMTTGVRDPRADTTNVFKQGLLVLYLSRTERQLPVVIRRRAQVHTRPRTTSDELLLSRRFRDGIDNDHSYPVSGYPPRSRSSFLVPRVILVVFGLSAEIAADAVAHVKRLERS